MLGSTLSFIKISNSDGFLPFTKLYSNPKDKTVDQAIRLITKKNCDDIFVCQIGIIP